MVLYYPVIPRLLCCRAEGRTAARMALMAMKPAIISGMAMLVILDRGDPLQYSGQPRGRTKPSHPLHQLLLDMLDRWGWCPAYKAPGSVPGGGSDYFLFVRGCRRT